MARLNVAKSVLLDADTRASYDKVRRPGVVAAGPAPVQSTVRYAPQQVNARPRHRVERLGQTPIGRLDLLRCGAGSNAEELVVVSGRIERDARHGQSGRIKPPRLILAGLLEVHAPAAAQAVNAASE